MEAVGHTLRNEDTGTWIGGQRACVPDVKTRASVDERGPEIDVVTIELLGRAVARDEHDFADRRLGRDTFASATDEVVAEKEIVFPRGEADPGGLRRGQTPQLTVSPLSTA